MATALINPPKIGQLPDDYTPIAATQPVARWADGRAPLSGPLPTVITVIEDAVVRRAHRHARRTSFVSPTTQRVLMIVSTALLAVVFLLAFMGIAVLG